MISLIIPAYNEEHRIGKTLERYLNHFGDKLELIVVLNGCVDGTEVVVHRYLDDPRSRVKMITLLPAGKGLAVRTGFQHAQGELIGFVDGDGSTSPEEYAKILDAVGESDGAIGSRWMPASIVRNRTAGRMFVSKLFVFVQRVLFGLPYRDTQCGAKVFRRPALLEVLPKLGIDNMAFDVELLWWFHRLGYRVREIPTVWEDQSSSVLLGSPLKIIVRALGIFWTLATLRSRLLFRHYTYGSKSS